MTSQSSLYPMVSLETAWNTMMKETRDAEFRKGRRIDLGAFAVGSFIASDILAPHDVPSVRRSIMDGYAVCLPINAGDTIEVAEAEGAGDAKLNTREKFFGAYVTTGSRVYEEFDVVVPVEMTEFRTDPISKKSSITILQSIGNPQTWARGRNIREIGSDVRKDSLILRKGQKISSAELGALLSCYSPELWKSSEIKTAAVNVKIIVTGNEIQPTVNSRGELLELSKVEGCHDHETRICDSICPMLVTELQSAGAKVAKVVYVEDDENAIRKELTSGCDECDVIVTTGGLSMGNADFVKPAIIGVGGEILFGRVDMKPGLPTTFSIINRSDGNNGCPVLSLPGNPVSAWVGTHLLLKPFIKQFVGRDDSDPGRYPYPVGIIGVTSDVPIFASPDGRPELHRVVVYSVTETIRSLFLSNVLESEPRETIPLRAATTGNQRSSRLLSLVQANALMIVPSHKVTRISHYPAGSKFNAFLIGEIRTTLPEINTESDEAAAASHCSCGVGSSQVTVNPIEGVQELNSHHSSVTHEKRLNTLDFCPSNVGIVIISDSVSRNERIDRSGPVALQWFNTHKASFKGVLDCDNIKVLNCPDNVRCIQQEIDKLAGENCGLIVCSGGTGLGANDVTCKAIQPLLESRCLGLEHLIIQTGLKHTVMAALSSPIVGVMKSNAARFLLVALPGSPSAVQESLDAIAAVLRHAIQLVRSSSS